MPNLCDYSCIVTGPKKGIDRFIQAATVRYTVGEPNEPEHFWRVFNFIVEYYEQLDNDIYQVKGSGDCAWSIRSCFTDAGYQSTWDKHNGITIKQISKEENLIIEMYSCECGCEFSEHYLIVKGYTFIDSVVDYYELSSNYTVKELNKYSNNNWTKDQWDCYFKLNDYYIVCEHNWQFTNHLLYLKEDV